MVPGGSDLIPETVLHSDQNYNVTFREDILFIVLFKTIYNDGLCSFSYIHL
jgi:hypothetical protein